MILVYRPELENPPMAKECSINFSFIDGQGSPEYHSVPSGVNRDFPEDVWEKIKDYPVVKNLLSIGALRIETEVEETVLEAPPAPAGKKALANLSIEAALRLIEDSMDPAQLRGWDEHESRIKVKNAIFRRIAAIEGGNG